MSKYLLPKFELGNISLSILLSPRSSLENPEPRTRARGIQLLSQVLLQCHSLLLEKEGTLEALSITNNSKANPQTGLEVSSGAHVTPQPTEVSVSRH